MTFFYNLNKKLDEIRATPELTHKQLNERDMSRAAKGYEKYGKEGMQALAKAGREGKALDPVRNKYDKYDDKPVDEGMGDMIKKAGGMAKKVGGAILDKVGHGSDADMIRDLQRKMGVPQTGMKPGNEPNPKQVKEKMNPAKQKSFAALAPPKDKITFADKIAGAKKEVDEMLGDVAAEAMKGALSGGQKKLDKNNNGKLDANDFAMLRKGGKQETTEEDDDNNPFTSWKKPRAEKPQVGSIERGHKHDIEHTATGRKVTRRVDDQGNSVGADDAGDAQAEKRGRGRPKSTGGPRQERVTAKSRKADRTTFQSKKTNEGDDEGDDVKQAMALLKKAGYKVSKAADGAEQVDEKATSKKQQKFMGMVHAAQKGEKPASKEVGKVAKTMKKSDAEDFASTKHKGLPEKKKPEGKKDDAPKKKEKTTEAGGTETPTASSGFSYGKGIYDSMNHDLENMIKESMSRLDESMNVSMNMNSDAQGGPGKSLTVTATDNDALKLGTLLKNAGLGGGGDEGYGGSGYQSACGCGTPDCSCGDQEMDEAYGDNAVSQNAPDYPTDTEQAEDNFEYSGGLDGPKSTGQSTVPVLASQEERQESYAAEEEDAIKRMMEMAGVKEAKKPDANKDGIPDYAQDGKGSKDLGKAKDKEKKVDEGILAATANLWKEYKVQAGV
jgi:hypothetical protein